MPEIIKATDKWVEETLVPRPGEAVKSRNVRVPVQDLLNNNKFLRTQLALLSTRLEQLERGSTGFELFVPQNIVLEPGRSYTFPAGVSVGRVGGYAQSIDLSALNLPAGVTATFAPDPIGAAQSSSDLTLTVAANAVPGPATVTIRAAGADGMVREARLPLSVAGQSLTPSFTVQASSGVGIDRTRGNSTQVPVAVNRAGGFGADIQFTVAGLPAGVTAAFNPATVTGSEAYQQAATTLTLTADPAVPAGTYSVQIRAASGGIVRTLALSLQITAPAAQVGLGDYTLSVAFDQGDPRVINGATITINRSGGFDGTVHAQFFETVYSASGLPERQRPVVLLNGATRYVQVDGGIIRVQADGSSAGWQNSGITSDLAGQLGDEVLITTYATINGQYVERSVSLPRRYGTRRY